MAIPRTDVWLRLLRRRVITPEGCWVADCRSDNHGYKYIGLGGKHGRRVYAHRLAYESLVGPLVAGLVIDHICKNRSCFNPEHLQQITQKENLHRSETGPAINARKTQCPTCGGAYTTGGNGKRYCGNCAKHRARRYRAAKSEMRRSE